MILNKGEVHELFSEIAGSLTYASVYNHSTVFHKGDDIQKAPTGDRIEIIMEGAIKGNIRSAKFDSDGMSLDKMNIVHDGKAVNYFGDNRYGQYLGEQPTGSLPCLHVATGSLSEEEMKQGAYLEIVSMSGLQVDFFSDYIGGEIRLAYYCDGETVTPVTGISISGSVTEALNTIRLSSKEAIHNGYVGPDKAVVENLKIF